MKAVISVIGKDKVGILAMIANECANYNLNVLDVTQTIVDSMFTMTMMVAIDEMSIPLNEFAEKMENLGKEKNLESSHSLYASGYFQFYAQNLMRYSYADK